MGGQLVVQLSDLHLVDRGSKGPGRRRRLHRSLALLGAGGMRPDLLLLSGDLADAGEGSCYEELAGLIARVAGRATVAAVPGNHDDRARFRRHLLGEPDGDGPINRTHRRDGLRVIALDSSLPGEPWGWLAEETLAYLRAELRAPAPRGTLVLLHHPPIPSPVEPLSRNGLRNHDELREAIAGSDVRMILCGHYHHAGAGAIGGVPVWISPAVADLTDVTITARYRMLKGSAISRIDVNGARQVASVVPVPPRAS